LIKIKGNFRRWCPGAACPSLAITKLCAVKPAPATALTRKGFPAHWQTGISAATEMDFTALGGWTCSTERR